MNRREAVQSVAILLGGSIIGGNIFMQTGCKPATPSIAKLFEPDMQSYLGEIAETILPATATPGAKAAGVGEFVPVMVRDCYTPEQQQVFLEGLTSINRLSKDKFKATFEKCTKEQKTELLVSLDEEQKEYQKTKNSEAPSHYFRMMKELTLLGFFTSKEGATNALRYVAVPGRYDGCVDYKKGDRAWAT